MSNENEKSIFFTLENYFHIKGSMNDDKRFFNYPPSFEFQSNAEILIGRVNEFMSIFWLKYQNSKNIISSGYRPSAVNKNIKGAAKLSKHLTCQAVDVIDESKLLAEFCISNFGIKKLEKLNLWIEDPHYTTTWVHFQSTPPNSNKRIFIP